MDHSAAECSGLRRVRFKRSQLSLSILELAVPMGRATEKGRIVYIEGIMPFKGELPGA